MKANKSFDIGKFLLKNAIYIVAIAMFVFMSILSKNFLTKANIINILRQNSFVGMMAVGVTFVIITGGIDLSIAATLAMTGMVTAIFCIRDGGPFGSLPLFFAILAGIIVSGLIGLVNGVIITKGKVAPFIMTLGMQTIVRGLSLLLYNGRPIINLADRYTIIGRAYFLGIPIPVWVFIAVVVVGVFLLHFSRYGYYLYAVGGNVKAAAASGINVHRVTMLAYVIAGITAGLAGIFMDARLESASPITANGYELNAIAAVVIGGTSLAGGVGTIAGTVVGILIMAIITNGLDLLNVSAYLQQIIKGVIIIIAALLDRRTANMNAGN